MNAHSPTRLIASTSACPAACPAEHIGRQIAAVQDRMTELDEARLDNVDARLASDQELSELHDRLSNLDDQLTWTRPASLAGVSLLVAQIRVVADMMRDEVDQVRRDADHRQIVRLAHLAVDGLQRIGGLQLEEIGLRGKIDSAPRFMELIV